MTINKYEVWTRPGNDEWMVYTGNDLEEALQEARHHKDEDAEIRYCIEELAAGGVNYNTIGFRFFVTIAETGEQLEECDSLGEAEKRIREMEDDDKLYEEFAPDRYSITDENGKTYQEWRTTEQAEADAVSTRWMREKTGLTRKAFCDKYGIPYRTMQDWEDGKSRPVAWAEKLLRRAVAEDFPQ